MEYVTPGLTITNSICVESTILYVPLNSVTICAPVFLSVARSFWLKVPFFWSANVSPLSVLQEPVGALTLWREQPASNDAAKMAANRNVVMFMFISVNYA